MEHWMAWIWIILTIALIAAFIIGLALDMPNGIYISLSYNSAAVVFQVLFTFLTGLYTWFWQDVDMFNRTTEPFRQMNTPSAASDALLLGYGCQPPGIVTHAAVQNKHWGVAWTSTVSLLQRLLPILTAASTTVIGDESGAEIYASYPLFVIIIIWLCVYAVLIPYQVFGNGLTRHLPRNYGSIADIISWCYASKILRQDEGDAFDVPLNAEQTEKSERWYMEARLRLKQKDEDSDFNKYSFGVYSSVDHPEVKCMGFDVASNVTEVDPPKKKAGKSKRDVEAGSNTIRMFAGK